MISTGSDAKWLTSGEVQAWSWGWKRPSKVKFRKKDNLNDEKLLKYNKSKAQALIVFTTQLVKSRSISAPFSPYEIYQESSKSARC